MTGSELHATIQAITSELQEQPANYDVFALDGLNDALHDNQYKHKLFLQLLVARRQLNEHIDKGGATTWVVWDQSITKITYDECTAQQAADQYVADGDWGEADSTMWLTLYAHTPLLPDRSNETILIALDPSEPKCTENQAHDWQSPIAIVGGIKSNPGVWGHGSGVITKQVCMQCGCKKLQIRTRKIRPQEIKICEVSSMTRVFILTN